MEEEFSMDDFILDDDDLNLENYNNPDEDESSEDVVGEDVKGTPSDGDDSDDEDQLDDGEDSDDNDNLEDDGKDISSSSNLYSSLAKVLFEEGVTPHLDLEKDKVESVTDLINVIKKEVQASEFSDLTEDQKFYLQAIREGIPENNIRETIAASKTVSDITDEDIESDEDLRLNIISQYYIAKGISEKEASKLAKRSVDLAEDIEDAKTSLSALKEMTDRLKTKQLEDARIQKVKQEEDSKQKLVKLKQSIVDTDEIIPGNKLTPRIKDILFDIITTPVDTRNGQPVNAIFKYMSDNPVDAQMKLAYIYNLTDGFKNMNKIITTKATSKAAKELEDTLRGNRYNNGVHDFNTNDSHSSFSLDDYDLI